MRKTKKLIALMLSVSMLAGVSSAMSIGAYAEDTVVLAEDNAAEWTLPAYLAANAVHSTSVAATDRNVTIGGKSYDVKALGSVSGGIKNAAPGEYNKQSGGTVTFKATVETAGKYDIKITGLGQNNRRADINVGGTDYLFETDNESEYAEKWTVISDAASSKSVFTYTVKNVELAKGENSVVIGTSVSDTWAPDLVGLDVLPAGSSGTEPTEAPAQSETPADEGMTFKDGVVTINSANTQKAVLIYAQYDGSTMSSVNIYNVAFENGKATQQLTVTDAKAKIMLWDSLESAKPIFGAIDVNGSATDPTNDPNVTEAPTAEPTPAPEKTPFPENAYYVLDFEQETARGTDNGVTGDKTADTLTLADGSKWESIFGAGFMSIAKDSNKDINMYYKYAMGSASGGRSAICNFGDKAKTQDENSRAVFEMDFCMSSNGAAGSQIVLEDPAVYGVSKTNMPFSGNYALALYQKDANTIAVATLDGADEEASTTTGYTSGTWAHLKGVLNFAEDTAVITITSLDGTKEYLEEIKVPMGGDNAMANTLVTYTPRNSAAKIGIDNVVFRPYAEGDVLGVYYMATITVDGKTVTRTADKETGKITGLPDTTKTGYIFDGWAKNGDTEHLMTNDEVLDEALTADVTYEAVYHKNPEYIEPMAAVEFSSFPENGIPTPGADANTAADNIIKLKLTGEIGTDLTANPDSRVTDLDVKWEFSGFRHIASKAAAGEDAATTDAADSNKYCDSYAEVVYDENDPTSVNFKLKSQAFNFYGQVKAAVTYNGKTLEIVKPMAIVPTKTADADILLPKPGYVENFDWYADDMVDYKATISADNKAATDIVTGDWAAYGGNSGRGVYIAKDENDKKFLKLKSTGTNSSSFMVNKLDSAPTGQVIISQDVKFYNPNSSILFKTDYPTSWSAGKATTFSFNFTGTGFTFNGDEKIADAAAGEWYHVVLAADVTSKLCFAKVYDMEGKLLGQSDNMPFSDAGSTAPVYLCYRTPDNANGELDLNNVKMYVPKIDDSNFKTTVADETLSIPDAGAEDVTTTITATALSTEGYDIIGNAEWGFGESVTDTSSLEITPDETDSHKAILTVKAGAPAGELPITVTIGGATKTITVNLTSSKDSVQFTKSVSSISIPIEEGSSQDYEYAAKVVGPKSDTDKTPVDIEGKVVAYAVYDKNNANELTTLPKGITFDASAGKLTVTSEAAATILYIRGTSTNRDNETITKAVKVTIHGLAFDFGTGDDGAVVEGYTAVTPSTVYNETAGYGIEGTATAGGTADAENADSDNLAGNFTFKVKVPKAKVYKVSINYKGSAVSEKVDSNADLTGVVLTNANQSAVTYTIPVIDDVLDIAFSGGNVASVVIEKTDDKKPNLKPHVFTVGDSTIANNGSWAYVMARDFSTYGNISDIVSFSNNGRGSQNLSSYYTGGELRERVLSGICPGDYVMIGDMGTNGMGAQFEDSFNYYIDACEALGAKIILNSYSPHGAVGSYANGYNKETHTFDSYRKDDYDKIVRKIYEERTTVGGEKYDAKVVGFVDIGKMADAAFNSYVAAAADKDAAANEIISCFTDHNHYSGGTKAAELMILGHGDSNEARGIVKALYEILSADLAKE